MVKLYSQCALHVKCHRLRTLCIGVGCADVIPPSLFCKNWRTAVLVSCQFPDPSSNRHAESDDADAHNTNDQLYTSPVGAIPYGIITGQFLRLRLYFDVNHYALHLGQHIDGPKRGGKFCVRNKKK